MSEGNDAPPIIVKKVQGGHGHHGGAWKVAYADFVTAMMALFIVLWILGQSEEVKEAVAGYFKDPLGFSTKGTGLLDGKSTGVIKEDFIKEGSSFQEMERAQLEAMGEQIMDELSQKVEFKNLLDQVKVEIVDEGLRVEMIEASDDIFFDVGSSSMSSRGSQILSQIGKQLAGLPNKVVVEGHTDSRPFKGIRGYTNFELSAERANSARRALTAGGLDIEQISEIRGYADNKLRDAKDPFNVVNRRISIIVKYTK